MVQHDRHCTAPPRALPRDRSGTALWPVWNTTLHLVVTSRDRLADARRLVIDQVAGIDAACNPFRPDSEVRTLQRARGRPVRVSAQLAELVTVSLRAALLSNGCLDPVSGEILQTLGDQPGGGTDAHRPPTPDWAGVRLVDGCELTVPSGTLLDLSSMAAAYTVDRCARSISERFDVGARVGIGGDIATAGQAPAGGWGTLIRPDPAAPDVPVTLDRTAAALSQAVSQRGRTEGGTLHHAFRPGGSRSAASVWRSVSVTACPCTYAKALSMAAMVRGRAAPDWLRGLGVSARLLATNGDVTTVGHWPSPGIG